jgi:hypothetical protein
MTDLACPIQRSLPDIGYTRTDDDSIKTYDPYDLWALDLGVNVRRNYYEGKKTGKLRAITLGLLDWLFPLASRRLLNCPRKLHPITAALLCLTEIKNGKNSGIPEFEEYWIGTFSELAAKQGDPYWAWGLGFPWMSKNGLYGPDIPFVTHTPYVMEALSNFRNPRAVEMLDGTWKFLDNLIVMSDGDSELALSYAPIHEPRIVVNANSYAAYAYALHAARGYAQQQSLDRSFKLANWILNNQNEDGLWWYYADNLPGNFIDCFHTCFVIKNLVKASSLIPELQDMCRPAIDRGRNAIRSSFIDAKSGLCRRFVVRDFKDPFVWDLYDQAEYLGLLIDFGHLDDASEFLGRIGNAFVAKGLICARIDMFGRKWGTDFLRWGIAPLHYQAARLRSALRSLPQAHPCTNNVHHA